MTQVLELMDTPEDVLVKMAEGNPGAMSVIAQIMEKKSNMLLILLNLDSLGIRGPKIWIGYKDYCKQDLDAFCELACLRDGDMLNFINKEMGMLSE